MTHTEACKTAREMAARGTGHWHVVRMPDGDFTIRKTDMGDGAVPVRVFLADGRDFTQHGTWLETD